VTSGYLLDNRRAQAGSRFDALSDLFDAGTFARVEALGLRRGGRCWEVGAGGPSVPVRLAELVGPAGQVVATDIDPSWLDGDGPVPYTVLRHDVVADVPPAGRFDLVHARLVLTHVPQRVEALRRMAAALRPGGWLLVEDFDVALQPLAVAEARDPEHHRANRIRARFLSLLVDRGVDLELGRALPRLLRDLGLVDVSADARFPVSLAAGAALEAANVLQVREGLVADGSITADEVDHHLAAVRSGRLDVCTPPLVAAWGRRPS
jgi:SAM-dependent methyltransferase